MMELFSRSTTNGTKGFFYKELLFLSLTLVLLTTNFSAMAEETVTYSSGKDRVNVIELFTSEGCSSCPPADFWLSHLRENDNLWNQFIPLSFHVDYWDYLGWKDKFSRAEFSQRQRRYDNLGQVNGVYTPGMLLNGREWKKWRSENPKIFSLNSQVADHGSLTLRYTPEKISIEYTPPLSNANSANNNQNINNERKNKKEIKVDRAYIALLGFNLESSIRSGENNGRHFSHNFVVLDLLSSDIQSRGGVYKTEFKSFDSIQEGQTYAIAAWLSHDGNSKPFQATGGWLPLAE